MGSAGDAWSETSIHSHLNHVHSNSLGKISDRQRIHGRAIAAIAEFAGAQLGEAGIEAVARERLASLLCAPSRIVLMECPAVLRLPYFICHEPVTYRINITGHAGGDGMASAPGAKPGGPAGGVEEP